MKTDLSSTTPIEADRIIGLTSEQVKIRIAQKLTNKTRRTVGKRYYQIFLSNIFTFFNFLGLFIFALMVLCNSTSNILGVVIVLSNTCIGIIQEIRSKHAVEKLSIVNEPNVTVVRDGIEKEIAVQDVVKDDILKLCAGRQICTDSVVLSGSVEVDESMLTGESDSVKKQTGDVLYSGSFVVSGNCVARCEKVGKDNYIEILSARVKKAKMPDSQLMKGIRLIIKSISFVVFPLGIATFLCSSQMKFCYGLGENIWALYFRNSPKTFEYVGSMLTVRQIVNQAIISASGAMLGMVPSGMVLLTSVALAVASLKLARKNVLVRELACIEMLARVDTLCLDKTGTLTDGSMTVDKLIAVGKCDENQLKQMLKGVVAANCDGNSTSRALDKFLADVAAPEACANLPFSSERKFSAAVLENFGTVAFGAAEFMFDKLDPPLENQYRTLLAEGLRVLAIGQAKTQNFDDGLKNLRPVGIVVLRDTVRCDAAEIIAEFVASNVDVKIISGDNPLSVSVIAQSVGVKNAEKYVSLEGMSDDEVVRAATEYTVFGRVTPEQKAVLVRALKFAGHTVAMVGDGVNDILAMRESDCAVSVGCGTDAARTVANLVLTDNKFGSMPGVVAEGRQVVNNIQNSTSLFLMKTLMVMLTTLMCLVCQVNYPFAPQHLYVFEFFIDGIPSFFLALKPNHKLIEGNFLANTVKNSLPSGIAMFLSVAACYTFHGVLGVGLNSEEIATMALFAMTTTGLAALLILLWPYDKINVAIAVFATVGSAVSFVVFPLVFELLFRIFGGEEPTAMYVSISADAVWFVVVDCVVCGALVIALRRLLCTNKKTAFKSSSK